MLGLAIYPELIWAEGPGPTICEEMLVLTTAVNIKISNILMTYLGQRNVLGNIRIKNCGKY